MPTSEDDRPPPWRDPIGVWQRTIAAADLMGVPSMDTRAAYDPTQSLLDALRSALIGRSVSVGEGDDAVRLTVTALDAAVGTLAASGGQADGVTLTAEDVVWRSWRCTHVTVRLHNFHTRFRARPTVVAAPVDLSVVLDQSAVSDLVSRAAPAYACEIGDRGEVRVRRAQRSEWGYVVMRASVEHGSLVLRPVGLGRREREWRTRRTLPVIRPSLRLPANVRLVDVQSLAGGSRSPCHSMSGVLTWGSWRR